MVVTIRVLKKRPKAPTDDTVGQVMPYWGYNPTQEEAYRNPKEDPPPLPHPLRKADTDSTYVTYQQVAETQVSNYFSDHEIDAAHILPPWMIKKIEEERREQGRRNERDRLRIDVPDDRSYKRPDDSVPEYPTEYVYRMSSLEQIL